MKDEYYLDPSVAQRYDRDEPGQEGDLEFYRGLALEAARSGHPVLELACGTGRVSIPIAQAGARVVGLDRSPAMLAVARRKAAGIGNVAFVEGDMAEFDLAEEFGLVFIPYRSFLHLLTVGEQRSCLQAVRKHLLPGGRFALNFFNPGISIIAEWLGPKRGGVERVRDVPVAEGGRHLEWGSRTYATSSQEIDETRIDERLDDEGAVISRIYRKFRLRYVFRYEMQHLLELCGFEIEALYGGFRGEPFTETSTEMVWVARKPADTADTKVGIR